MTPITTCEESFDASDPKRMDKFPCALLPALTSEGALFDF
jgi:hypothetical protein